MTLYIHQENQEILWKVANRIPQFQQINTSIKKKWFKSVIQMFYEREPIVQTVDELREINRKTIQYICQCIVEKNKVEENNVEKNNSLIPLESRNFTENKTEIYSNLFNTRKKEYETQPVLPENLDFSIEKDEPIQNMEELIEQHRLEREKDL